MTDTPPPPPQRIQKLIAETGVASRRQAEVWIKDGRVCVNGQPATLGDRASPHDGITLDGRRLSLTQAGPVQVLAYHKRVGQVTTRADPEGRRTIFEALPPLEQGRWVSVGRLDIQTSGLLLVTTDGVLAHGLMHPSRQLQRRYRVHVNGVLEPSACEQLLAGVDLEDGPARFEYLRNIRGQQNIGWYEVALREGRNREIRRMIEAVGMRVSQLVRIGYGPIGLDRRHRKGTVRPLSDKEIQLLSKAAELPKACGFMTPAANT